MTEPPALPSPKRILPAALLAGTFGFAGLHRFYAGRHLTGALQLILFAAGAELFGKDLAGITGLRNMDDALNWALEHPVHPVPVLVIAIPVFWALIDCGLLLGRRFKDGSGRLMTRWM